MYGVVSCVLRVLFVLWFGCSSLMLMVACCLNCVLCLVRYASLCGLSVVACVLCVGR